MTATKLKQREPNGRHKRPTAVERAKRDRDAYQVEMRTVLQQPHRKGQPDPTSPWCVTALGRFCLKHRLRRELHDCGAEYAALVNRWRAAKGVPLDSSTGQAGNGLGPSEGTVRAWERQIEAAGLAMRHAVPGKAGNIAYEAVRHIAVDGAEIAPEFIPSGIAGLLALAVHMGHRLNHPFV